MNINYKFKKHYIYILREYKRKTYNELLKHEYSLLVTNGIEQELSAFLASYGILVTVILLSVVIACGMFLTKKPKEILSEMS